MAKGRLRWLLKSTGAELALLVVLCTATSCHSSAPASTGAAAFKVALLTPGLVSDAGWNAAAFQGLQEIEQNLNVETALVQTSSPADFEDSLRDFASRGFNIVFAHGFEYIDAALRVGKLFAKTRFIVTSGSGSAAKCVRADLQDRGSNLRPGPDRRRNDQDRSDRRNQNAVEPDNVLASAVTHIPKAFVRIATEIKSGEFRGGMLEYGMKEGMVEVVYNPRLQSKISAATLEMAKEAEQQIIRGKIVLG